MCIIVVCSNRSQRWNMVTRLQGNMSHTPLSSPKGERVSLRAKSCESCGNRWLQAFSKATWSAWVLILTRLPCWRWLGTAIRFTVGNWPSPDHRQVLEVSSSAPFLGLAQESYAALPKKSWELSFRGLPWLCFWEVSDEFLRHGCGWKLTVVAYIIVL